MVSIIGRDEARDRVGERTLTDSRHVGQPAALAWTVAFASLVVSHLVFRSMSRGGLVCP